MKKLKVVTIMMIFIMSIITYMPVSRAASLTISTSQSEANTGDSVTITINGNGISGRINLSATGGTLDQSSVWVENSKATATVKITGSSDVRITATATKDNVADSSTGEAYEASTGATIKVKQNNSTTTNTNSNNNTTTEPTTTEPKKSSNANLANLGITPNDFRGFKTGTLSYNVTVPNDVDQVNVYAKVQDSKAKITSGTGNQKLNVGQNALKVVVTAEDGTTKTYTVNVTREEKKETNENNTSNTTNSAENNTVVEENTTSNEKTENEKSADLIKLEIEGYELTPKFSPDVYEYTLNVNKDVDNLKVITEGANHNVTIDVVGNTELKEGENIVTILVHNEETKQDATYQITVNKVDIDNEGVGETLNNAIKKANKIRMIIFGVILFVIICIVIFIIAKRKYNKNEDEYDYYDDEDEDETYREANEEMNDENTFQKEEITQNKENRVRDGEESVVKIANSIAKDDETVSRNDETNAAEQEEPRQFFRASKPKRKGKHF